MSAGDANAPPHGWPEGEDAPAPGPMPLPPFLREWAQEEALTLLLLAWLDRAGAHARLPDPGQARVVVEEIRRDYQLTRLLSWHPHGWRVYALEHRANQTGHLVFWDGEDGSASTLGPWNGASSIEAEDSLLGMCGDFFAALFDPDSHVVVNHRPDLVSRFILLDALHNVAVLHEAYEESEHEAWMAAHYREDPEPSKDYG